MIKAYIARPKAAGKDAPVMAIQEKSGLDPHTEAITRRAAPEGSLAMVRIMIATGNVMANNLACERTGVAGSCAIP